MFKKVIVVTDLSQASYSLISCLDCLKAYGTKECLLMQCINLQSSVSISYGYYSEVLQNTFNEQKDFLEKQGYDVEARLVTGSAKNAINRIAMDEDYSVIVVGAESENILKAHLFGTIAYDVINYAEKPVMVIRLAENYRNGQVCIDSVGCDIDSNILFPSDFSENADVAFELVKQIVANGAKKITLAHVQDKALIIPHLKYKLDEFNEIDKDRLEKMKIKLQELGSVEVDTVIRFGSPVVEILNIVKEKNIKLVVMGSQGRGFARELFLGNVSNNIARKSASSVLLVPAKR